jgi:hypothetical protein
VGLYGNGGLFAYGDRVSTAAPEQFKSGDTCELHVNRATATVSFIRNGRIVSQFSHPHVRSKAERVVFVLQRLGAALRLVAPQCPLAVPSA